MLHQVQMWHAMCTDECRKRITCNYITVDYQQIVYSNITHQIHRFIIDHGKFILICDYCFFLTSFIVDKAYCKWTGRGAIETNVENESFAVMCSHCH